MFSVGRYDPDADRHRQEAALAAKDAEKKKAKKSRKRRSNDVDGAGNQDNSIKPKLRVIAPEQNMAVSKQSILEQTELIEVVDDTEQENELRHKAESNMKDVQRSKSSENHVKENNVKKKDVEVERALLYSKMKIQDAAKLWNLAPFLVKNLEEDEYQNFFPIQALVIPDVIASERHVHIRTRDICVSAPTGSGKTLAFALPILNALSSRKIRRLRALVVLPGRDLATQVYKVFERYAEGSDLTVGLAIGQTDFEAEQKALIIGAADPAVQTNNSLLCNTLSDSDVATLQHILQPLNVQSTMCAFGDILNHERRSDGNSISTPISGRSAVDILICTPGRLMDHLEQTPAFTLQHLRFLVMDEADRLLNQSYQNWISRVLRATTSHLTNTDATSHQHIPAFSSDLIEANNGLSFVVDPMTWRRTGSGNDTTNDFGNTALSLAASTCRPVQLRRLLFSATMTSDPQKLASLGLVNPKYFDAHHLNNAMSNDSNKTATDDNYGRDIIQQQRNYSVPPGLSEYTVECTTEQKPLVLLALLLEQRLLDSEQMDNGTNLKEGSRQQSGIVVVFTSSLEATHRLMRLLQLLWVRANHGSASSIVEFSSSLNQKQRKRLLQRCNINDNKSKSSNSNDNSVSVVVCSDGMSRGMDISSVTAVINYDIPTYSKTYIHRCGRTARAGRKGRAITLLVKKGGQQSQFSKMRALIENPDRVQPMGVRQDLVENAIPMYKSCIGTLRRIIQAERDGDFSPTDDQIIYKFLPRSQPDPQVKGTVDAKENKVDNDHTNDQISIEGRNDEDSSSLASTESSDFE